MNRDNSPCIEHLGGNRYRCVNRGYLITTDVLPIHCACGQPPPQPVDAAQWFTTYYAKQDYPMLPLSAILARLERCRSANCEKLQNDVCTMLGSNPCKQRSNWFRMLAGGAVCPNWKRKIS